MKKKTTTPKSINKKTDDLVKSTTAPTDQFLTTSQGLKINDNQNSLKSGDRGSTLLEDFILREKITHFDCYPIFLAKSTSSIKGLLFMVIRLNFYKAYFFCEIQILCIRFDHPQIQRLEN